MLNTFDIFDTLLTRPLSCPQDVFLLLAQRLRQERLLWLSDEIFQKLRIRSERWAARLQGGGEVKLEMIYDVLGAVLCWSDHTRQRASEIEKELESELLMTIPLGAKALQQSRDAGYDIGFVSDMYLDSTFLRSILEREGLFQPNDRLKVSCECGASKANGRIWHVVQRDWQIAFQEWQHRGDNLHGDVRSPRQWGITAERLGTAELSRWERWPSNSTGQIGSWGKIATMSRLARALRFQPDSYAVKFGTGVLGPWVMGFASWTLAQAKERGLKTLWFLSRDAWWFFEAARRLPESEGLDLRYVAINRNLLRVATEGVRPQKEWFTGSRRVTWDLLQQRWQMTEKDIGELRLLVGDVGDQLSDVVDTNTQQALIHVLESSSWQQVLKARALESGERVRKYLEQCALGSSAIGLVDVGWHGRSQAMLRELCPAIERGFYIGLCNQEAQAEKHAWLFDTGKAEGALFLNQHQRMLEVFLGGVSGPLLGYSQDEGQWHPIFSEAHDQEVTPGLNEMHQAATCFIELGSSAGYRAWWDTESLREFTVSQLERLLERPIKEDARFFSVWQVTTDDGHQDLVSPAKGYDRKRVQACLLGHEPWAMIWPKAAYLNSRPCWKIIMKSAWHLRSRLANCRKKLLAKSLS